MRSLQHLSYILAMFGLIIGTAVVVAKADPVGTYDSSGTYEFAYGSAIPPTLRCTPTKVCVLRLQTGETVYDKVAGDTVHWIIGAGAEGADGATPLIFFEPLDTCNRNTMGACYGPLTTNLIITTDKHTYEVRLEASGNTGRTRYGFFYPREQASSNTQSFSLYHATPAPTEPPPPPTFDCLTTIADYRIDASQSPSYTPKAVCNNGESTFIIMPPHFSAPSIYEVLDNGQTTLVNAAPPVNGIYIIPGLPRHLVLVGDVGRHAPHIDIWKLP